MVRKPPMLVVNWPMPETRIADAHSCPSCSTNTREKKTRVIQAWVIAAM